MTTVSPISSASFKKEPSYATSIDKAAYDMKSVNLKTLDIESAKSSDKNILINYYDKLMGFLAGTTTATDYAAALKNVTDYVLTADDYTKLRDGEISVKDYLKDVIQSELYSTAAGSEGYYVKLYTALQSVIDSVNKNLVTPLNTNFSGATFFPTGTITEDFLSPEIKTELTDFCAGNTVITASYAKAIDATTDVGTTAATAASSYTKKPCVIVVSDI